MDENRIYWIDWRNRLVNVLIKRDETRLDLDLILAWVRNRQSRNRSKRYIDGKQWATPTTF